MKTLTLPLKRCYFEAIRDGKKPFEFRLRTKYWQKRLVGVHYDFVEFTDGYPPKSDTSRRIIAPYRGYHETTVTHSEWGDMPQEVFAILTPCHP